MHARTGWLAVVALAAIFFGSDSWAVCYVNQNATGKNDGSSWGNAYTHPQFALLSSCIEIWVAKGFYTPSGAANDPSMTFDIPPATKMYGGFSGGETSIDQRNRLQNITVLSGDVDHNDAHYGDDKIDRYGSDINGLNSWHVVTIEPITSVALAGQVLDGFVITGGDAYTADPHTDSESGNGGGILCSTDAGVCRPMLSNLAISGNRAWEGGGIFMGELNPDGETSKVNASIANYTVTGNQAEGMGGGVFMGYDVFTSKPNFSGVSFISNIAGEAGAVVDDGGNSNFSNCMFYANTANDSDGGAVWFQSRFTPSTETLVNVTFSRNASWGHGGAIFGHWSPLLTINTVLWNDYSEADANEIYIEGSEVPLILNSVVQSGCPIGASCTHVSSYDPSLSSMGSYENFSFILIPGPSGSAVDAGSDSACPPDDLRKVARPQGAHCDIGAVEWRPLDDLIFRNGFQ